MRINMNLISKVAMISEKQMLTKAFLAFIGIVYFFSLISPI